MVAWRSVDSGVDLSCIVMTIPLGSRPKAKKTSFLAPSSPPEVMEVVNVPSEIVVNGAEAKSLPGTGGLMSTYA